MTTAQIAAKKIQEASHSNAVTILHDTTTEQICRFFDSCCIALYNGLLAVLQSGIERLRKWSFVIELDSSLQEGHFSVIFRRALAEKRLGKRHVTADNILEFFCAVRVQYGSTADHVGAHVFARYARNQ